MPQLRSFSFSSGSGSGRAGPSGGWGICIFSSNPWDGPACDNKLHCAKIEDEPRALTDVRIDFYQIVFLFFSPSDIDFVSLVFIFLFEQTNWRQTDKYIR